jgi:hypothetical protein
VTHDQEWSLRNGKRGVRDGKKEDKVCIFERTFSTDKERREIKNG